MIQVFVFPGTRFCVTLAAALRVAFLSSSHRAQGLPSPGLSVSYLWLWATYQLLPTLESRDLRISGHQLRYGTASNSVRTAWTCTGQGMCLSSFLASTPFQTTDSCPLENAISICFLVTWEACVWSAWISCDSYNYSSVLSVTMMVIMSILLDRATQTWCIRAHMHTHIPWLKFSSMSKSEACRMCEYSEPAYFPGYACTMPSCVHIPLACPQVSTDWSLSLWWTQIWGSLSLDTEFKNVDRVGAGCWTSAIGAIARCLVQRDSSQLIP